MILLTGQVFAQEQIIKPNTGSSNDELVKKLSDEVDSLSARTEKIEGIAEENGILFSQLMAEFRSYISTEKIFLSGLVLVFLGAMIIFNWVFMGSIRKATRKEIAGIFSELISKLDQRFPVNPDKIEIKDVLKDPKQVKK